MGFGRRPLEQALSLRDGSMIRITKKLDSDTLHLPELRAWLGKTVEITVLDDADPSLGESATVSPTLRGSVVRYTDPFEPAASADEWEAQG